MSAPYDRFGIDPIGTAGHHTRVVLMEWPLPWSSHLFQEPELAPVAAAVGRADERGEPTKVLALVPGTGVGAPVGLARIIRYVHDGAVYRRSEALVDRDDVLDQAVAVIDGADPEPPTPEGDDGRDVLVCTHGRRDARCGKHGLRLFNQIAARWPDVRVWRVSHIGGHRFAPTGMTFPEGWVWGNLDVDVLDAIVGRTGDPAELAHHLRGNPALPEPAQVVDRLAWMERGWPWLERSRRAQVGGDDARHEVELVGGRIRYGGVVGVGREVPTTLCDSICDDQAATTPELALLR